MLLFQVLWHIPVYSLPSSSKYQNQELVMRQTLCTWDLSSDLGLNLCCTIRPDKPL